MLIRKRPIDFLVLCAGIWVLAFVVVEILQTGHWYLALFPGVLMTLLIWILFRYLLEV